MGDDRKIKHGRIDKAALADGIPGYIKPRTHSRAERKGDGRIKRKTPLRQFNPERHEDHKAIADGEQSDACRILPCCVCGREGASVPHHVHPQGNGGTDRDTIPMCDRTKLFGEDGCHDRHNRMGALTFWRTEQLNPSYLILAVQEWMAAGSPMGRLPAWRAAP